MGVMEGLLVDKKSRLVGATCHVGSAARAGLGTEASSRAPILVGSPTGESGL